MDEMKSQILDMVKAYAERRPTVKPFSEGDSIRYAGRVYDAHEMVNLVDSALEFWLTAGKYTEEFERKFADYIGVNDCLLVNSGSSANLLAFMSLTSMCLPNFLPFIVMSSIINRSLSCNPDSSIWLINVNLKDPSASLDGTACSTGLGCWVWLTFISMPFPFSPMVRFPHEPIIYHSTALCQTCLNDADASLREMSTE